MKARCTLLLVAVSLALTAPVFAQSYPSKPVRLILPYPPGGSTDILGRMTADVLTKAWGQSVIPDNRPGASGNIGATLCARSPADGYTMCTFSVPQTIAPNLQRDLSFDPFTDFTHVTLLAVLPSLLVVHPSVPAKTVREVVTLAKSRPGALSYASTGNGSSPHMLMEMFKLRAGVNIIHVPYKGSGPAMIDQISGQIQVSFSTAIATLPFVTQGKLRVIAVSTKDRFPLLPEAPTIDESGIKGFDGASWQGLAMPAGVPRPIVDRINAEVTKALASAEIKQQILKLGGIAAGTSPEGFAAFVKAEIQKWAGVAKATKLRVD